MSGLHTPKPYREGKGWRCDGYIKLPDHTSRRITGRGRTQQDARDAWLANAERALAGTAHPRQRIGEYLETWLSRRPGAVSPGTVERDTQIVHQYLVPAFGMVPLESLTQGHVRDFVAKMKADERPKATIQRILAPLKRAFSDAVRDRVILSNPVSRIEIGSDPRPRHKVQVDSLKLAAVLLAEPPSPSRDLIALLAMSGLRLNEARGLVVSDLHLQQHALRLEYAATRDPRPTRKALKTSASRRMQPLPLACVQLLQQALLRHEGELKPDAWVFDRGDGVPPTMSQLQGWFHSFCKRHLQETGLRIHDLRGGLATALAESGATVSTAQKALGHTNVLTTLNHYSFSHDGAVKRAMDSTFGSLTAVPEAGQSESHQKSHQISESQPVWQAAVRTPGTQLPARKGEDGGGERGIRTLDGVAPKPHFHCGAIDH